MATKPGNRVSLAEYHALVQDGSANDAKAKKHRAGKYNNSRSYEPSIDFHFDSKAEHRRWKELKQMEAAGLIKGLWCQKKYTFEVNDITVGTAIFDFQYTDLETGEIVIEDVKGYISKASPTWRLFEIKRKLMAACYGVEVRVITQK